MSTPGTAPSTGMSMPARSSANSSNSSATFRFSALSEATFTLRGIFYTVPAGIRLSMMALSSSEDNRAASVGTRAVSWNEQYEKVRHGKVNL